MNEKQDALLTELHGYAVEIREDWSNFDGRELLDYINEWLVRFHTASAEK